MVAPQRAMARFGGPPKIRSAGSHDMFANCDRHTETEAPNSERGLPESTGMSPLSLVPEVSILEGAAWEENYSAHR